jgi:hypothetical protein
MSTIVTRFFQISSAILLLLCSCATQESIRPCLPAEASFKDAGHGKSIDLTLRLENGMELLFAVDTGAAITILDKSLESILGKRLGKTKFSYAWYGKVKSDVYAAPKLYLGGTQLLTADRIYTDDLSRMESDRPLKGILGLDCLQNYCIQLDFATDKIRFLDPDHLQDEGLGERFPLDYSYGATFMETNLFGRTRAHFEVDTGCEDDAALEPRLFQKTVQELHGKAGQVSEQTETATGAVVHRVLLPEVIFHGETWTNLSLSDFRDGNLLGLRFLARHLTTLNFPKGTMYLQRVNDEAIAKDNDLTNEPMYAFEMEADKFLANLKKQGRLPGSPTNEHGEMTLSKLDENAPETFPIALTCIITKKGDVCTYHYLVVRASNESAWKLQRAWRTDAKEHLVEEYHVP